TTPDWQACGGNEQCNTQAEVIAFFKGRGQQVPDLKWDIKEIIVSGNRVIVRGEGSGTPVATSLGVAPTGKACHVMPIDVHPRERARLQRPDRLVPSLQTKLAHAAKELIHARHGNQLLRPVLERKTCLGRLPNSSRFSSLPRF